MMYLVPALDGSHTPPIPSIPVFTVQPSNTSVTSGSNATFVSKASGVPRPTYQWQVDTGSGFSNISGATSRILTLTSVDLADDSNEYRVIATNTEGTDTSDIAVLTVTTPTTPPVNTSLPAITGTPTEGNVLSGSNGTWSGSAAVYTYQWLRDGADISGATSNTYTLVSADIGTDISFRVNASNIAGSASATSAAVGPITTSGQFTYLRPGGIDSYLRPNGIDSYIRP